MRRGRGRAPRACGWLPIALLVACGPREGALGIPMAKNGVTYAGAAVVDLTPVITETFTDLDGDATFDGCHDDPTGTRAGCDEPFHDADGDGKFDAVWIGGFGPLRPANEVHDPVTARAIVIAQDKEYVAFVSLDLVGLASPRIHAARDALSADGFVADRLLACSTHNHQGPDTMGLWGDPYDFAAPISGMDEAYQQRVTAAIEQAVRAAAADMEPVSLRIGRTAMRDRSEWFNGANWGGKSPDAIQLGLVHDGRDPVIASDQLLVLQGRREDGSAVFTWTSWSGHPEVRGSENNAISSDWVGAMRDDLEDAFPGSIAVHVPESLGGMQSALGGDVPLVDETGAWVLETDGTPLWAPHNSWEFVRSHGRHLADAAIAALDEGEDTSAAPIRVEAETIHVPIENVAYKILGQSGIFDLALDDLARDTDLCPEASDGETGCIETRTMRAQVGPLELITVPGELLPELFWGLPTDAAWQAEVADPGARGAGAIYFPQHDPDCDDVGFEACREDLEVGACDCLAIHAWPYALAPDPALGPMVDLLDAEYRAAMSMTDNYLSYVVPEPDFHRNVSLLSPRDGDHYEDTVSPGHTFATRVLEAQVRIDERW